MPAISFRRFFDNDIGYPYEWQIAEREIFRGCGLQRFAPARGATNDARCLWQAPSEQKCEDILHREVYIFI